MLQKYFQMLIIKVTLFNIHQVLLILFAATEVRLTLNEGIALRRFCLCHHAGLPPCPPDAFARANTSACHARCCLALSSRADVRLGQLRNDRHASLR
ncbi:MAG: hypothetical protein ACI83P_001940 [Janthinobacterium sp.]